MVLIFQNFGTGETKASVGKCTSGCIIYVLSAVRGKNKPIWSFHCASKLQVELQHVAVTGIIIRIRISEYSLV
jgi:hypothetical protein